MEDNRTLNLLERAALALTSVMSLGPLAALTLGA